MNQDRITLFISARGAAQAADHEINSHTLTYSRSYRIAAATLRDNDTGHIDKGFKVELMDQDYKHVRWL